ncbi:hypothetical protein EPO34_03235 [Patescibacteria group bacterium]|nr:MAG: hypothetical protein EPO34_03235 [Patescibacteria group bacterium]
MYFLLLGAACGLFAFVAWRDLKGGVLLLVAALPAYLLRIQVGPVPSTLLELLFGLLFVVFALTRRDLVRAWLVERRAWQSWYVPLALLILAAGVGMAASPVMLSALGLLKAYVIEPILLFLIVRDLFVTETDRMRLLQALAVGGAFAALVGIAQYALNAGIPAPWDIERRVTGPFPYPNALGLYLAPIITIAGVFLLSVFARRPQPTKQSPVTIWFWSVILLLCSVAIFLSQTEAAWVSIPPVLFLAALREKRLRVPTLSVGAALMLLVFAIPAGRHFVSTKLLLQDASGQVRIAQWQETIAFLKDGHWLLGAGLAGYPGAIEPYHTHPEYEIFQDPHNVILNVWVELGLLGLIGTALLAWQVVRTPKRDWVALAASFALLQMLIHGLVDVPFFKNDLAMMTFVLLALVAAQKKMRSEDPGA